MAVHKFTTDWSARTCGKPAARSPSYTSRYGKDPLFIGAGSFAGGIARYLLSRLIQSHAASGFPWGTLAVNVAGCLAIGLLYGLFERGNLLNAELRLFLTVGFCGGFTTFSTFIHENYALLGGQQFLHFAGYALLSFALGMLAAHLGHLLVRVF